MQVSVVVPVWNAVDYVREAVGSALAQPETDEVILVEDGSPDNSLEVCSQLASEYPKVRLLRHWDGKNHGASASRNLGMANATADYIAFLDADDWYLPGRFAEAKRAFMADTECDGVYEAVGIHFEDERGRERWLASPMAELRVTSLKRTVPPDELFRVLSMGGSGHVHLDGLVLKRPVLDRRLMMNEALRSGEDTDFVLRVAAVSRLRPGRLTEPVAVRRVHEGNRISAPQSAARLYRSKTKTRMAVYRWCRDNGLEEQRHLALARVLWECAEKEPWGIKQKPRLSEAATTAARLASLAWKYPDVVLDGTYRHKVLRAIRGAARSARSVIKAR
ncbi:glycosyltransferase family 2 protein [candidate division WOR-3 bacterium]|nr:glycosyltransferase family 2 protein [candidate division WOR-3 bacterium]